MHHHGEAGAPRRHAARSSRLVTPGTGVAVLVNFSRSGPMNLEPVSKADMEGLLDEFRHVN